jgi:hypothetical protein
MRSAPNYRKAGQSFSIAIVADSEGIGPALDAAMEASVAATYDPWREANEPKTTNQFDAPILAEIV